MPKKRDKERSNADSPLRITFPIPPRVLSPNARTHWAVKAKATKYLRQSVCVLAREANAGKSSKWMSATCKVLWYAKTRRRMDRDNCLAMLKAAFDGLVDAGVLVDDCGLTHLPLEIHHDAKQPRVELLVSPHEEAA